MMASFVLMKVDLDLGNYERFLDIKLTRDNNITTGKIYQVWTIKLWIDPCFLKKKKKLSMC